MKRGTIVRDAAEEEKVVRDDGLKRGRSFGLTA